MGIRTCLRPDPLDCHVVVFCIYKIFRLFLRALADWVYTYSLYFPSAFHGSTEGEVQSTLIGSSLFADGQLFMAECPPEYIRLWGPMTSQVAVIHPLKAAMFLAPSLR